MKKIVRFLFVCFIPLQLAAHHRCNASEEFHPLKQGPRIVTGPLLSGETTLYRRDFDGGYVTVEVSDTIVFLITVTTGSYYVCNVPRTIEQNGNHYDITSDSPGVDDIHITWSYLNGWGDLYAGQTAVGTMSTFPSSFTVEESFILYCGIWAHRDYFVINPVQRTTTIPITTTTSSTSATTSAITTSTLPPPFCLAEEIYGKYAEETALLRRVRDELLRKTPEGQELIRLYYQWHAMLARVPGDNAGIREDIKELIDELLPLFEKMVE